MAGRTAPVAVVRAAGGPSAWPAGAILSVLAAAALAAPSPAGADVRTPEPSLASPTVAPPQSAGESTRVYLITVGPGPLVWERFGHNALWISDAESGVDLAYNWGMFTFDQPGFLARLLRGTMLYWMAPFPSRAMIEAYVAEDRSTWIQELSLTDTQKAELKQQLSNNALPENRFYRYDYYRDNCSTRVRDALDRALGGQLRSALAGVPSGTSYRSHTRRLLQGMPAMYTGIQLVLSGKTDRSIDRWEQAFLPLELMRALRSVRVVDGAGVEGPLVISERQVHRSVTATEPEEIPDRLPWYLATGLALAGLPVGLARRAARARILFGLVGIGWSVVAGVAGIVLAGAWLFTDHVFLYGNWNLLQVNPLSIVMGGLLSPLILGRRPPRVAIVLGAVIGALSLVGMLAHAAPGVAQRNGEILAVTVPANVGLAVALLRLRLPGGREVTRASVGRRIRKAAPRDAGAA